MVAPTTGSWFLKSIGGRKVSVNFEWENHLTRILDQNWHSFWRDRIEVALFDKHVNCFHNACFELLNCLRWKEPLAKSPRILD